MLSPSANIILTERLNSLLKQIVVYDFGYYMLICSIFNIVFSILIYYKPIKQFSLVLRTTDALTDDRESRFANLHPQQEIPGWTVMLWRVH